MRILKTCIRFLRSIMSRIRFTIITNYRLWLYFSELAALACKSFFFFSSFVAILAHIRVVHGARAAIAAWKCCGFWRTHGGTIAVLSRTVAVLIGISIAILLFAKFLNTEAMTLVTGEVKPYTVLLNSDPEKKKLLHPKSIPTSQCLLLLYIDV